MRTVTPALVGITSGVAIAAAVASGIGHGPDGPPELGRVSWGRDLDAALQQVRSTGKPGLVLFQEIPGCQGCVDFGTNPLSHPLLVEAMETEFVPVAFSNNRGGMDDEIRRRYEEPSWNFPVMRFVDGEGKDIVARRDRIWSTGDVAERLITALRAAKRPVPEYLKLAALESSVDAPDRATFAMHCYWDGEADLGRLDGVLATRAGWVGGDEVVEVWFDPATVTYRKLVQTAKQMRCARTVYAHSDEQSRIARDAGANVKRLDRKPRDASASDRKFALGRTPLRYLPLTPMQATRVNAALRLGKPVDPWLSPRQRELRTSIEAALKKDEAALARLRRPDEIGKLAAYEAALRERLRSL